MIKAVKKPVNKEHALDKIKGEVEHIFERLAENWHDFESTVSEHLPDWVPKFRKPRVDASESDDQLEFSVELPGMEPADIEVSVQDGVLVIEAQKESETEKKKRNYYLKERSSQKYYRSFALPEDVIGEKISAACNNGLLVVTIPRKERKKVKVQKVNITS